MFLTEGLLIHLNLARSYRQSYGFICDDDTIQAENQAEPSGFGLLSRRWWEGDADSSSPRVLAELPRSADCFSIPVFGVAGVAVIDLQTCSHHPYRGESGLDLSLFIICQMTTSTSQFQLAPPKHGASCSCRLRKTVLSWR